MAPIDEILAENLVQALPVSAEDWTQTPESVQALVVGLLSRLQALEAEVARLGEQLNRNSGNSSRPPSSDGQALSKTRELRRNVVGENVVGNLDTQEGNGS